jgi:hypothetical protein
VPPSRRVVAAAAPVATRARRRAPAAAAPAPAPHAPAQRRRAPRRGGAPRAAMIVARAELTPAGRPQLVQGEIERALLDKVRARPAAGVAVPPAARPRRPRPFPAPRAAPRPRPVPSPAMCSIQSHRNCPAAPRSTSNSSPAGRSTARRPRRATRWGGQPAWARAGPAPAAWPALELRPRPGEPCLQLDKAQWRNQVQLRAAAPH